MRGFKLDQEEIVDHLGVINNNALYVPGDIFLVKDFNSQEQTLEKILANQGIKKENLTIANLEQVKTLLRHKRDTKDFVNFDKRLIQPKNVRQDMNRDLLRDARKMQKALRHIGPVTKPITIDMLKHKPETIDLKTVCDFHMKDIDIIRNRKNLEKVNAEMRAQLNHSTIGKPEITTDFMISPTEKMNEIKRLESIKADFERAIGMYPNNINLKDSYTRYRHFCEEIIKEYRTSLKHIDFIDDFVKYKTKELNEAQKEIHALRKELNLNPKEKWDFVGVVNGERIYKNSKGEIFKEAN